MAANVVSMFPALERFAQGRLQVGAGNEIYWETSGNPQGKPILYLHGGPGSGAGEAYRQRYDPTAYLIVSFDQRGCGRSSPLASDDLGSLATNTTARQIRDIEALREHLGIRAWLVSGVSWGSTLTLAYAQAHPERVTEIILTAVTTTTATEVEWLTADMGRIFPREWDAFVAESHARPGQRVVDAYYERITHPDEARHQLALADRVEPSSAVAGQPAGRHRGRGARRRRDVRRALARGIRIHREADVAGQPSSTCTSFQNAT